MMKKQGLLLIVFLAFSLGMNLEACVEDGKGFFPENDFKIPVDDEMEYWATDEDVVDEATFNRVIDEIEEVYAPIVAAQGGKLVINRLWDDATVNAYAQRKGSEYHVSMFGGLARHPAVTPDGFALVVCHELGHHLAGYPRYDGGNSWASSEGQSDYFATTTCFKEVYGYDDNLYIEDYQYSETVDKFCSAVYADDNERATCIRATVGGQSLANLLASLQRNPVPNIDTPNSRVVSKHDHQHPHSQCRLDTYFQGAICDAGTDTPVGGDVYKEGYCARINDYESGVRPLCWFSPEQAERELGNDSPDPNPNPNPNPNPKPGPGRA